MKSTHVLWARKNRRGNRVYPLTGLLEFEDGTPFKATSGNGRLGETHYYYQNPTHKIYLKALDLEDAVIKGLRIYEKDSRMLECANEFEKVKSSKSDLFKQQINSTKRELLEIQKREDSLCTTLTPIRRYNFLIFRITRIIANKIHSFCFSGSHPLGDPKMF